MNPLRICIDARLNGGESGGIESVVIGMASGLSGLTDGDEQYLFLAQAGADEWIRPYVGGPCRMLYAPSTAPRRFMQWLNATLPAVRSTWRRLAPPDWRLLRLPRSDGTIEKAGIDVMHFTYQAAFLTGVPSIYHPHDLQHLHLPEFFNPYVRRSREITYRAYCEQARMVPVTASWGKCDLLQHYGLAEEKVQLVPWAPVLEAYPSPSAGDLAAARRKFCLPEVFVFFPSQTWAHKNHMGLLEALAILRDRYDLRAPLVCSGRLTEFHAEIRGRVRQLRLADQVQFLGFVSPLELQCVYRLCRCVVIPTKFEAASGPLWEAFAAGVPAACSNVTSLPDQAGDAALLFNPCKPEEIAGAICQLWRDEALRRSLVERGKRNVARFTWERTARIFRAHYRRIANRCLSEEDHTLLAAPPLL